MVFFSNSAIRPRVAGMALPAGRENLAVLALLVAFASPGARLVRRLAADASRAAHAVSAGFDFLTYWHDAAAGSPLETTEPVLKTLRFSEPR